MNELEITLPEQYTPVLSKIDSLLPLANIDTENFNKSASQFKSVTLDVVDLTPINSAKHLLAVVQRTRQALEEASINLRRKKLELKRKELELMSFGPSENQVWASERFTEVKLLFFYHFFTQVIIHLT